PSRHIHRKALELRLKAAATAGRTAFAVLGSRAAACRTRFFQRNTERACDTAVRLFQRDGQLRFDIRTTLGEVNTAAAATPPSEQLLEKVAEAVRATAILEEVAEVVHLHARAFCLRIRGEIRPGLPV